MANAVELLRRRRGELSGTARQAVDLLSSEVNGFQRTVVDLLEISRDDQQVVEIVDVADLVRHVLAVRPGPAPDLEAEAGLLVPADRRRLDRVIANLLDNADDHANGPVRVAVRRRDGRVRVEVDDRGPGVPGDLRERVFDRFARGVRAGRRGDGTGSGLGLALVARHVRRHGGDVWVEDRPGGGARFVVELPATHR
jgi:signal transduction histidine kinase